MYSNHKDYHKFDDFYGDDPAKKTAGAGAWEWFWLNNFSNIANLLEFITY
jgi:hypothetical protein